MNVFQGRFPLENSCADGYAATAPVDAFPPNGYGLYNTTGNVWERRRIGFTPLRRNQPGRRSARSAGWDASSDARRLIPLPRSHCNRYRVDARSANEPDSSAGNVGFRVAGGIHRTGSVRLIRDRAMSTNLELQRNTLGWDSRSWNSADNETFAR